jgi:hypothetical protein
MRGEEGERRWRLNWVRAAGKHGNDGQPAVYQKQREGPRPEREEKEWSAEEPVKKSHEKTSD